MAGKNKRSHEHGQLKKEEWEAMESAAPNPASKGPFDRASGNEMKRRRIVRVSDAPKWNSLAGSGSSGSSLFANVNLTATGTPPKSNPFAQVSTAPQNAGQEKIKKFSDAFLQFMITNSHQEESDWDHAMKDYLGYCSALKKELFANNDSIEEASAVQTSNEKPSSSGLTPSNNSNSAPSFGFSVKPKDDTKAAPSKSFSFGAPTAGAPAAGSPAAAPATAFTGFQFQAPAASTATPTPPAAASVPAEKDKAEESAAKVQDPNSDSQVLHEVTVACYKSIDDQAFKQYGKGTLSLEKSKSGHHSMVMRNGAGKINLNVAISKGMIFVKTHVKKQAIVSFVTQEDGKKVITKLRVDPQNLDDLHANLQKLAKKE